MQKLMDVLATHFGRELAYDILTEADEDFMESIGEIRCDVCTADYCEVPESTFVSMPVSRLPLILHQGYPCPRLCLTFSCMHAHTHPLICRSTL